MPLDTSPDQYTESFVEGSDYSLYLYNPAPDPTAPDISREDWEQGKVSDGALFHIKSNISGKILPYLSIKQLPSDGSYVNYVRNKLSKITSENYDSQEADRLIETIFPARPVSPSKASLYHRKPETSVTDLPTSFNPLLSLHYAGESIDKPYAEALSYLNNTLDKILSHDGDIIIKREWAETTSDIIKNIQENQKCLPDEHARLTNKISLLSSVIQLLEPFAEDLDKLERSIDVIRSRKDLSNAFHRVVEDLSDPYECQQGGTRSHVTSAAIQLLLNDCHTLKEEQILSSKSMNIREEDRLSPDDSMLRQKVKSQHLALYIHLSSTTKGEEKRNFHQAIELFDGSPQLLSSNSHTYWSHRKNTGIYTPYLQKHLLANEKGETPLDLLSKGVSLRQVLAQALLQKGFHSEMSDIQLSKRECQIFLHNINALERLKNTCNTLPSSDIADARFTLFTFSGESIDIDINTKDGRQGTLEARITYKNSDGKIIIPNDEVVSIDSSAMLVHNDDLRLTFNSPINPIVFSTLPVGKINSLNTLIDTLNYATVNHYLIRSIKNSIEAHKLQKRDSQGRKHSQSNAYSWVEHMKSEINSFKYQNANYINDGLKIIESLSSSFIYGTLSQKGLTPESESSLFDLIQETKSTSDLQGKISLLGTPVDGRNLGLSLPEVLANRSKNYTNDLVKPSDKVHQISSSLKEKYAPKASIAWLPSCPVTQLGNSSKGPLIAKPLHSYNDIQEEGSEMQHCAATYSSSCMNGTYYLYSICRVDDQGQHHRVSTLGLEHDASLIYDQHFGVNNSQVDTDVDLLVKRFANGLIKSSRAQLDNAEPGHDDDIEDEYEDDLAYGPYATNDGDTIAPMNVEFTPTWAESLLTNDAKMSGSDKLKVICGYEWDDPEFLNNTKECLISVLTESTFKAHIATALDTMAASFRTGDMSTHISERALQAFQEIREDLDIADEKTLFASHP